MKNKILGFLFGIYLFPILFIASGVLNKSIKSIIDAYPSLHFLIYIAYTIIFLVLIAPIVLPIVMWKRNKTFSLTFIISSILLGLIFIPGMFSKDIDTNDRLAQSTLRTLSTASETFAEYNGAYPNAVTDLTQTKPPYIIQDYCETELSGFRFNCEFNSEGYRFSATPVKIGVSGTKSYTIVTGGILE